MRLTDRHRSRRMADAEEALQAAAFGLEGIHRKHGITAPAGMHDMILTTAETALHPAVDNIKGERRVHADGRVKRGRRLPRPVTHSRDKLADGSRRVQEESARDYR